MFVSFQPSFSQPVMLLSFCFCFRSFSIVMHGNKIFVSFLYCFTQFVAYSFPKIYSITVANCNLYESLRSVSMQLCFNPTPPPPPPTDTARIFSDKSYALYRYASWMVNDGMGHHRVYVDETGLNLHVSRTRGRSAVGERAARVVCGQRGRNMSVIMAISDQVGVLYYEVVWGGVTAEIFSDFLTSLGAVLGDEPATVLMDNAPAHRGAELADPRLHQVRKLAPYSPFLNPIENMFSVFKAYLKQRQVTCRLVWTIGRRRRRQGTAASLPGAAQSWRTWRTRPSQPSPRRRCAPPTATPTPSWAHAWRVRTSWRSKATEARCWVSVMRMYAWLFRNSSSEARACFRFHNPPLIFLKPVFDSFLPSRDLCMPLCSAVQCSVMHVMRNTYIGIASTYLAELRGVTRAACDRKKLLPSVHLWLYRQWPITCRALRHSNEVFF